MVHIPFRIPHKQEAGGPLPERNGNQEPRVQSLVNLIFFRMGVFESIHIRDNHWLPQLDRFNQAVEVIALLKIHEGCRCNSVGRTVIPQKRRPDFHSQINIKNATQVTIVEFGSCNQNIFRNYFPVSLSVFSANIKSLPFQN